jgi:hypothetical protein
MRFLQIILIGIAVAGSARAEDTPKPTRDCSTFDPAAAIEAANQLPEPKRFERLWTAQEGVQLLHGLAISADGKRVLACNRRGECEVYDGETGKVLGKLQGVSPIVRAALSPNGMYAAVALVTGEVATFDTASGKELQRYGEEEPEEDEQVANAETDDALAELIRKGTQEARKKTGGKIVALAFADDNRHVGWVDNFAGLYRVDAVEREREGHVFEMRLKPLELDLAAFSPDARQIVCGQILNPNHEFLRVKARDSNEPEVMNIKATDAFKALSYAQSEHYLAYTSATGNVVLQQQPLRVKRGEKNRYISIPSRLTADVTERMHLSFSTDEKWLIAVGRGQVELRPTDASAVSSLHEADFENAAQVAIAGDGLRIAVVDQDGQLAVLSLSEYPEMPLAKLRRTVADLVRDKQFDHLEKIAEIIQDDPSWFPGATNGPKYDYLVNNMLGIQELTEKDDSTVLTADLLKQWLEEKPDARLGRLLQVRSLIHEAWQARGDGLAITVTRAGWRMFNEKIEQAHESIDKLLAGDHPPPEAFMHLFDIAKGEGWDEDRCMEQAERVMKISPQYLWPHVCIMQNFLVRWGGATPHSSALYASWAADKIGGAEGDAFYVRLVARLSDYDRPEVVRDGLGIDYDRVWKGCAVMQKDPERRAFGLIAELHLASVVEDHARASRVAKVIEKERTPFVSGAIPTRGYLLQVYQRYVNYPE